LICVSYHKFVAHYYSSSLPPSHDVTAQHVRLVEEGGGWQAAVTALHYHLRGFDVFRRCIGVFETVREKEIAEAPTLGSHSCIKAILKSALTHDKKVVIPWLGVLEKFLSVEDGPNFPDRRALTLVCALRSRAKKTTLFNSIRFEGSHLVKRLFSGSNDEVRQYRIQGPESSRFLSLTMDTILTHLHCLLGRRVLCGWHFSRSSMVSMCPTLLLMASSYTATTPKTTTVIMSTIFAS
jgi:hypothetical protein